VLYAFGNQEGDGVGPSVNVHDRMGNHYGRTISGGANSAGTVFKLSPDGTETILYSFCSRKNCSDGEQPNDNVIMDKRRNLYGTTQAGGKYGQGEVFKVTQAGTEKVLYSFTGGSDGGYPVGGLLRDGAGNLYGTTDSGGDTTEWGSGCGVVFKLARDGTETVLHVFEDNGSDGASPEAPLIMDANGNLYGTTEAGGTHGYGTVFEISSSGTEMILYSFANGSDGGQPLSGLMMDTSGNLYGVTFGGGQSGCFYYIGCGVVYKLAPDGTETTLYAFKSGSDGGNPYGTLITDSRDDLFGATTDEGNSSCDENYGCGTIFEVTPDDRETVLYLFKGLSDGGNAGGLIWDPAVQKDTLYGGAYSAGAYGDGVAFSLTK